MTRTQVRNGMKIQEAALAAALAGQGVHWMRFTIADVAKRAGMSKPTAVKYLKILQSHGIIREEERDMRYCIKSTPITYVWTSTLYPLAG